ncbi:YciI family protein [Fulvivirga sedimenti]|uniref:YciI family protein n=1 Tax=Fulvivirga sedimenti TaxID=2879465 RepID=A0A9X1KZR4_9BACT|nr:YciI family protein [Fulvivirga sedimenti]MCA6078590.1 YciI family protein [Fulvivirga sedimenti]
MKKLILLVLAVSCFSGNVNAQKENAQEKFIWVFLNTNPEREELPAEEVEDLQRRHLENIGKLASEGKLIVAGPFNSGGGIFILKTADRDEAKGWILTDPAIRANRYKIEMFEWTPRTGSACQASPDAAMGEHTFVRYVPHITKFNVQQSPELYLEHDNYLKKHVISDNILAEGIFDNNDGGILIFKDDPDRELIMSDPTVINGIFLPEIKTIWVADGSFCENK